MLPSCACKNPHASENPHQIWSAQQRALSATKDASGRLEAASTSEPNHARLPRDAPVSATGPHGCPRTLPACPSTNQPWQTQKACSTRRRSNRSKNSTRNWN